MEHDYSQKEIKESKKLLAVAMNKLTDTLETARGLMSDVAVDNLIHNRKDVVKLILKDDFTDVIMIHEARWLVVRMEEMYSAMIRTSEQTATRASEVYNDLLKIVGE